MAQYGEITACETTAVQRWVWDLVATRRARSRDVEADDQLIIRLPASLLGVEATFQIEVELEQRSLSGLSGIAEASRSAPSVSCCCGQATL
jgi:hypothetical protein